MTKEERFLRLEFRGERFTDGLFPVSALPEVQRITEAIQKTAFRESPKQEVAHIDPVLSFTKGCVVVEASVPPATNETHAALLRRSGADVAKQLGSFNRGNFEGIDKTTEIGKAIIDICGSLDPDDEITLISADETISITGKQHTEAKRAYDRGDDFQLEPSGESGPRSKRQQKLVGQFTELDAGEKSFKFKEISKDIVYQGYYGNPDDMPKIKESLNSPDKAEVVRITCDMRIQENWKQWHISGIQDISLFHIEPDSVGASRIIQIASLGRNWNDGDEPAISDVAIDAALKLLEGIAEKSLPVPGIFPTEEGGISLEWADAEQVVSVEIDSDLDANAGTGFNLFSLPQDKFTSTDEDTGNLIEAQRFIEENVAVFQTLRSES
ncbi:hypothetical protein H3S87_00430 [Bifidobacterium sp. W8108]|uniref:hypothetical protein n=1 Tax=unclassified Bifidobacterium TaxID=2608897 RepID=UPI0018DC01C2|nr:MULTISPECIES: hypothetical protein [unclassified Bifidobacterium]MBH9978150.1 hypothetical protein [Bifidobacterium sp. W8108]MBI0173980.1 hypothetical protein [Bifidobacterium sp. M0307]